MCESAEVELKIATKDSIRIGDGRLEGDGNASQSDVELALRRLSVQDLVGRRLA